MIGEWRCSSPSRDVIHTVSYQEARTGGGIQRTELPIVGSVVRGLPGAVEAIICCSDLQGVVPAAQADAPPQLVGEVVADELAILAELGVLPAASHVGVLLAGDFYAIPTLDQLGGYGDAWPVWLAFARRFRWVVGVAGNHDDLTRPTNEVCALQRAGRLHLLDDGASVTVDGLRLAGVSGVIGRPTKPWRKSTAAFEAAVRDGLQRRPDVLVLHEGPDMPMWRLPGQHVVRTVLERASGGRVSPNLLVVCGHCYWDVPIVELGPGIQVLNVDHRLVVAQRAG